MTAPREGGRPRPPQKQVRRGAGASQRTGLSRAAAGASPASQAAQAAARVSPARMAALQVLLRVGQGKGHSDVLLHSALTEGLSPEDRGLVTALVMGVLRWQTALDTQVRRWLERPQQRLAEPVAVVLRLGALQLLHLDRIPAHAALSESVELCRAAGEPQAAGMVNAILRKVAAAGRPGNKIYETPAAFAERLGHPLWMVERWVRFYGVEAARHICEADQQEPAESTLFARNPELPVMDDGSRLVAELAAACAPGARRVWDACAAPGGKTLILANRLAQAELLATDVSSHRVTQMQARLRRYPYAQRVATAVADATALPEANGSFDLILCDVPCSGTGTLAANPEIRHRLQPGELVRQAERQLGILRAAARRLAPGGRLVYATCSLEPEECEQVVEASGLAKVPVQGLLDELRDAGVLLREMRTAVREGALRTLPGVDGCDGFYAAVLEQPRP
ncbi:MAG: methyltransferase domain-containing protein [Acidobacteriota bacterium]|nr:methyltransferase domain-containing protein [Acidobacteriota bacterium]